MVSGRSDEGDADIWIYASASFHLSGTGALREAFSGTPKKESNLQGTSRPGRGQRKPSKPARLSVPATNQATPATDLSDACEAKQSRWSSHPIPSGEIWINSGMSTKSSSRRPQFAKVLRSTQDDKSRGGGTLPPRVLGKNQKPGLIGTGLCLSGLP